MFNNVIQLNECNVAIEDDAWGDDIGFGASLKPLLKVTANKFSEASNHIGCSFYAPNREALPAFPYLHMIICEMMCLVTCLCQNVKRFILM